MPLILLSPYTYNAPVIPPSGGSSGVFVQTSVANAKLFDPYWEQTVLLLHGDSIVDECGKALTMTGNVTTSSNAKFGNSLYFNGSSYLATPNVTDWNFGTTLDYTIECWINTTYTGSTHIWGKGTNSTAYDNLFVFGLNYTANKAVMYYAPSGGAGTTALSSTTSINDGQWHHIALCRASGTTRLFVDGIMEASTTATYVAYTSWGANNYIGVLDFGTGGLTNPYVGYMDDLRITKGVARYTSSFAISNQYIDYQSTDDPYWAQTTLLLRGDGANNSTAIKDETGKSLTLVGNAKISTAQSKFGGSSLYFNGTGESIKTASLADFAFGTKDFTIELWVRPSATKNSYPLLLSSGIGWSANNWNISDRHDYTPTKFSWWNYNATGGAGTPLLSSTSDVVPNVWTHLAFVRSGNVFTLFVNGVAEATKTQSFSYDDGVSGIIQLGDQPGSGTVTNYNGYIDDVRITKGVARYTSNFSVPSAALPYITVKGPAYDYRDLDPYYDSTVLLLRGEGYDNSTHVYDETGKAVTLSGNAKISTSQKMFGSSSIYIPSGSYVQTVSHSDFILGTSDFTIEFWYNKQGDVAGASSPYIVSNKGAWTTNTWVLSQQGGVFNFWSVNINGVSPLLNTSTQIVVGTWYHVALVRSTTTLRLFVNGVLESTYNISTANLDTDSTNSIWLSIPNAAAYINAYVDDLRITKGIARYTAAFTPPAKSYQYDNSYLVDPYWEQTKLLIQAEGSNNSTDIRDVKGHAITVVGGAKLSNAQALFGTGSSVYLATNGDCLTLPFSSDFNLGNGDVTAEAWIYMTSLPSGEVYRIIGLDGITNVSNYSFALSINANAKLEVLLGNGTTGSGYYQAIAGVTSLTSNTWHHVAGVRSGNTIYLFINGRLDTTATVTGTVVVGSNPVYIGTQNGYNPRTFKGYIDDLRFTKGVARYISNFTPVRQRLPDHNTFDPYWDSVVLKLACDGANNSTVITDDKSHAITVNGNAKISTAQSKFGGSSLYFDGSSYVSGTSSDFSLGTSDFTVEMWIYPTSLATTPNWNGIFSIGGWPNTAFGINSSQFALIVAGATDTAYPNPSIAINIWYHLCVVRASNSVKYFVNGVQIGAAFTASGNITQTALTLGGNAGASLNGNFYGYIDDFRITKGVARYMGNFPVPINANPSKFYQNYYRQDFYDPHWSNVSLLLQAEGAVGSTSLYDSSPKALAITNINSVALSNTQSLFNTGTAMYFNGNQSFYVSNANGDFDFGTGDFTIEFWLYFNSGNTILGTFQWSGGPSGNGWGILATSTGVNFRNTSGNYALQSSSTPIANTWTHVAFTRQDGTLRVFLNGVLSGTATYATSLGHGVAYGNVLLVSGKYTDGGGIDERFTGYLDDLRITKGFARYTKSFAPPRFRVPDVINTFDPYYDNVVLYYKGDTLTDSKGHAVTVAGNTQTSTFIKVGTSSIAFDGSGDSLTASASADFVLDASDFTLEFWYYPISKATSAPTIVNNGKAWGTNAWAVQERHQTYSPTKFSFFAYNKSTTTPILVSTTSVTNGVWYHLTITRSGTNMYLFVNGVLEDTYAASTTSLDSSATSSILVGSNVSSTQFINAYVQSLRLSKGVSRYTNTFPVPVKYYPAAIDTDRYMMLTSSTSRSTITTTRSLFNVTLGGSVEFWVNPSVSNAGFNIVYGEESGSGAGNMVILTSNQVSLYFMNDGIYTPILGPRLWYHIVFTWTAAKVLTCYVNGVLTSSKTSTYSINNLTTCFFGKENNSNNSAIAGVRSFRFYNTAISQAKVTAQYNNGKFLYQDTPESGLIGAWNFNTRSTVIHDYSGNGLDFTLGSGCSILSLL